MGYHATWVWLKSIHAEKFRRKQSLTELSIYHAPPIIPGRKYNKRSHSEEKLWDEGHFSLVWRQTGAADEAVRDTKAAKWTTALKRISCGFGWAVIGVGSTGLSLSSFLTTHQAEDLVWLAQLNAHPHIINNGFVHRSINGRFIKSPFASSTQLHLRRWQILAVFIPGFRLGLFFFLSLSASVR